MANAKPFKGLRPVPEKIDQVASPPYDVLNSAEAREKVKGNSNSFLHVIKPEIDLDPSIDPYDERVYAKGAENLKYLIDNSILIQDDKPCYYVYKLQMGGRIQTGLVAVASVEDYNENRIKKHEFTRAVKEQDRLNHIDNLNAQTGPVLLTYRSNKNINMLIDESMKKKPVYEFTGDYEVRHTFYMVDDDELINGIRKEFNKIDALYIADGHHRSAAASRLQKLREEANSDHNGEEEYNYFLSVIFPHDQMFILDYNRVVKDLNGRSTDEFLAELADKFIINETEDEKAQIKPQKPHEFGMYLDEKWYCLEAKEGSFDKSDPIESLDVAILQNNLLEPVLNIKDVRKDERIDFVGGIRGLEELEKRVNRGGFKVAFSMYPTTIEQLLSVADAGKVMPPKSTWFEPKLRSGIVVHKLD